MVMACIDLPNMQDCMMSPQPNTQRLPCRFPYNQMVKINTLKRWKQTELSHVETQTREQLYRSGTDGDGYSFMEFSVVHSALRVGCRMCFALRPGIRCGWLPQCLLSHRYRKLSKPFFMSYIYLFIAREGEVCGIPSDQMQGFRWQPPPPIPSSSDSIWAPHAPSPVIQPIPWVLCAAAGAWPPLLRQEPHCTAPSTSPSATMLPGTWLESTQYLRLFP